MNTQPSTIEVATLLVLLKLKKKPWHEIAREVRRRGSAEAYADSLGLTAMTLDGEQDLSDEALHSAMEAVQGWAEDGLGLQTVLDPAYPDRLSVMKQLPPFLFWRGSFSDEDARGVAIVGSRRATPAALDAAGSLAAELARAGVPVLSGLAAGIDTQAHEAALAAGGRTVAVIGTGIKRVYPSANRALQERIADEGLLLSQFWPDAAPSKVSFPMRNGLMSAWGRATCVVQADARSGARLQARLAVEQGRTLYLYRLLEAEPWAQEYVKAGTAIFVDGPQDMDLT